MLWLSRVYLPRILLSILKQIKTSGGARVVVTLRSRGINIQITLSARDKGKTSGLCGTFDDDPTNDFIPKDKTTSIKYADWGELNRFIESWR